MSDDHKEQKMRQNNILPYLLQKGGEDPLGRMCGFLGPGGGRQIALVNKDLAKISSSNEVYESFLNLGQEDEKEKKSSALFQQQTPKEFFKDEPWTRLPKYYPCYIADQVADRLPIRFFSLILEEDKNNIAAQSGLAFWSIYNTSPGGHPQQAALIQLISGIAMNNPTHTESLYYLAKLIEDNYLDSSYLKKEIPGKNKNLGGIIYEALGENIRKDLHKEVYTALGEKFLKQDATITPQILYEVILLLESSHPGASYARACFLKEHKAQTTEIVAERARLLRNVWPVDHRDFGALCEFIEMMYERLITPTEEDFVALNQLLERGCVEPTTMLGKLQMFVDYANAKTRNNDPKLRKITAKLVQDKEAIRKLSLLSSHFGFLKNVEHLPYKQQRLLIEAAKAKKEEGEESLVFFMVGLTILYSMGIYAVSIASLRLAIGDLDSMDFGDQAVLYILLTLGAMIFCALAGAGINIYHEQILREESSIISHVKKTFREHWKLFFPEMDAREQQFMLELQLLPTPQRQSINHVFENFSHLDSQQQERIRSAARDVEASYVTKFLWARRADASFPWFVVVAILAPSGYGMYMTNQIDRSLSIRMETILAEVVLASLVAYFAYMYFSRNVPAVLTDCVYKQQQNAMVARIAEVAEIKEAPHSPSFVVS